MPLKEPPYLKRVSLTDGEVEEWDAFPYSIPSVRGLDLRFGRPITFLLGENGSG
ncbi:MAG TPA: hypothetical protein VNE62_01665 [Actinomycetota bacterium]|nr:hypothetical protein [Actinomycetota bacterium]